MNTSAELLEGLTLDEGWVAVELLPKSSVQTGGVFSCSYRIEHPDGRKAFLKAMDFEAALSDPDPAGKLKELTESFVFERTIVELCGTRKLSRVIRAQGSLSRVAPSPGSEDTTADLGRAARIIAMAATSSAVVMMKFYS